MTNLIKQIEHPTETGLYRIKVIENDAPFFYNCLVMGVFPFLRIVKIFNDDGSINVEGEWLDKKVVEWYKINWSELDKIILK